MSVSRSESNQIEAIAIEENGHRYREWKSDPFLRHTVECLWTTNAGNATWIQRVVPDSCADILWSSQGGIAKLEVVGPMTTYLDAEVTQGDQKLGMRFRPGRWGHVFGVPGNALTDRVVPLEDLWGRRARELAEQLGNATTERQRVSILRTATQPDGDDTPIKRAISAWEQAAGLVPIAVIAREANLSVRQFRRVCVQHTGLSPKFLGRVLRFRHALSGIQSHAGRYAFLAADCGFADQAHLIAEFRNLAGRTPAEWRKAYAEER